MAQERAIEYNVPITSFQLNRINQGLFPGGRYQGFDSIENPGGASLEVRLTHPNGLQRVGIDNLFEAAKRGVAITPQGTIIHSDEETVIPVDDTAGGARKDLVILDYSYAQVTGGAAATLSIITGTPLSVGAPAYPEATLPTLPNPQTQVVLGVLHIADTGATARAFSDLTYVPAKSPTLNGSQLASLAFNNTYGAIFSGNLETTLDASNFSGNTLILPSAAKEYLMDISAVQQLNNISPTLADGTSLPDKATFKVRVKSGTDSLLRVIINQSTSTAFKIQMGYGYDALLGTIGGDNTLEIKSYLTFKYDEVNQKFEVIDLKIDADEEFQAGKWFTKGLLESDITMNTGAFTFGAGSASLRYVKIGKRVTANITISNCNSDTASIASFKIDIPSEIGVANSNVSYNSVGTFVNSDDPTEASGTPKGSLLTNIRVQGIVENKIVITPALSALDNFFCTGTDNLTFKGQIEFEVE